MNKLKVIAMVVLAVGGLLAVHTDVASAQAPRHGLLLDVPIQSIEVRADDELQAGIELDVAVVNFGQDAIEAEVVVEGPDGWQASLYHKLKAVSVGRLSLKPSERAEELKFRFVTPIGVENGSYTFSLRLTGVTGALLTRTDFTVLVDIPREAAVEEIPEFRKRLTGGFEFDTRFSQLTTPVGQPIGFRVNIRSRDLRDLDFLLDADAPLGWKVVFKPSFQSADVRALAVRSGTSASLDVVVTPPPTAAPGAHPVVLRATAVGTARRTKGVTPLEVVLQVELTGVPDLRLTTASGLLTIDATAGETTDFKFQVVNSGGGSADNVRFVTSVPPGWGINIDNNPVPRIEAGGTFEVTVSVTPPDKTVPGDYDFQLIASMGGRSTGLMVSVTVVRSTMFAVLGVALIGVVALGLGGLFVRLTRP
jgi:uncharacterized membrane protein